MPSYYNSVKGTIDSGKTARSGDIHLIQSSIQDAMQRMIVDMFGTGFILGESEDALKLYPLCVLRNFIMALPLNLLIVSPIVRFIFNKMFPVKLAYK